MRRLIYDVAASLDGFISGPDDDVSGFVQTGAHADAYFERLKGYDAVLMGRATYEFGYAFGMKPGDKPYPHLAHHVVSSTIQLPADCGIEVIRGDVLVAVDALKAAPGGDIYLCGGGVLAGQLLRAGHIDALRLKLNPVILGEGVPLFTGAAPTAARLVATTPYDTGVVLLEYDLGA